MRAKEKASRPRAKTLRVTMTEAEIILWSQLRKHSQEIALFRRQHPIGPYIADFACVAAKLVIEIDGGTHSSDEEVARDERRTAYLEGEGWRVMRFTNDDVYRELNAVLSAIWRAVPPPSRPLRLRRSGEPPPP